MRKNYVFIFISAILTLLTIVTYQNCSGERKLQEGVVVFPSAPPVGQPNIAFSAGGLSTCAIKNNITYCWGDNTYGQLGDGTKINKNIPTRILSNLVFTSISVGTTHTCGVTDSKLVYCWGDNSNGQLGNGTLTESLVPVLASNLQLVYKVAAGHKSTCALSESSLVYCWGTDQAGQLGSAVVSNLSTVPIANGIQGAKDIEAATGHPLDSTSLGRFCVVNSRDAIQCWGASYVPSQTSGLPTYFLNYTPVTVTGVNNVRFISLSTTHSCAALAGTTVQCWGNNSFGQMGIVTPNPVSHPVGAVANLSGALDVAVGSQHSCALTSSGSVQCWGLNRYNAENVSLPSGQLGQDPNQFDSLIIPATVQAQNVVAIEAGHSHTCININDSELRCFGYNSAGQLGVSGLSYSFAPQLVQLP